MAARVSFRVFSSLIIFLCTCCSSTYAANILGLFTSYSSSHLIVNMGLANALAERGHNVTVVCSSPPKTNHHPKLHIIVIPYTAEDIRGIQQNCANLSKSRNTFTQTIYWKHHEGFLHLVRVQYHLLKSPRFQQLYQNPHTRFDLVISAYFFNDFQLGVAGMFKCPVIVNYMMRPFEYTNALIGNPDEIAYAPTVDLSLAVGERMSFGKRLENLYVHLVFKWVQWKLQSVYEHYYNDLFPQHNFPSLRQMQRNVSLMFHNHHFSEGAIRPNVPALIEIGGIQIKEQPNALPQDIADFMQNAKNGVILLSLGTILQISSMVSPVTVQQIFQVFANLEYSIIWKWEQLNSTPGKSANILYKQWLPQDDILAHPKLKLFITHAGKGGIAEAQYHGVPMIALPSFADQQNNADLMVNAGYGLQLQLTELKAHELRAAILEVLSNSSYATNIKRFSQLYRDRPLSAKQAVVYWTEYVLRHHGAAHMQSPLLYMSFIEAHNLDILALFAVIIFFLWQLFKLVLSFVFKSVCKRESKLKQQ